MAGTLTLGYSLEGQGTLTNEVPSVITSAFDSIGISLPASVSFSTVDPITGTATLLDDPAQYTDGLIDLGYDQLSSLIDTSFLSSGALAGLDPDTFTSLLVLSDVTGGGTLTVGGSNTSFSWNYSNNVLSATGYDPALVDLCQTTDCAVDGTLGFSFGLGLDALTNSATEISAILGLPEDEFTDYLTLLSFFGNDVLSLASADLSFGLDTQVLSTNPDGGVGDLGGTLTGGSVSFQTADATGNASEPVLVALAADILPDDPVNPGEPPVIDNPPTSGGDTSGDPSQDVPEPAVVLGLLAVGAGLVGSTKRQRVA